MKFTKASILVFLVLAMTYAYFFQDPGANGDSRLALTMAIVKEGRLNIDTFNSDTGGFKSDDQAVYLGKHYTDKAIGSSVLGAVVYYPIYKVLGFFGVHLSPSKETHLLTFLVIGLPSAIAGTLIYILCEYLSKSRFRAFIVSLAIALGTMCFPFSIVYFGHQLAACFLFGAFFMTFQIKTVPEPGKINHFHMFAVGFLLGLALLTDMTTAVVVLPLIVYYFYVLWSLKLFQRIPAWVAPLIGGLIPVALMLAYNTLVYGNPLATGYEYLVDPEFKVGMSKGIMGIGIPSLQILFYETLHPAQGIFWQSPVLIMTLVGGYAMLRKKQVWAELAVVAAACGFYLLLNAGYFMWWGGWSFGLRQIVPMLPFLCLPLIYVPKKYFPLVVLLTFVSVAQMTIVSASMILVPDDTLRKIEQIRFFQYSTIYTDCLKELLEGRFAWNIGQNWLGLKQWASLMPLGILILGATAIFARLKPESEPKAALA